MHIEAEYGVAAHFAYKEKIKLENADLKKQYEWVEQLRDTQGEINGTDNFFKSLKMDFFQNRVFVFTPQGDVIDLPEDSTPIDFAYHIHSDIGDSATGAKINGKFLALDSKLKSGDICEIVTAKNAHPNEKWLKFVKTGIARNKINQYLRENSLSDRFSEFKKYIPFLKK
jgi:GTP pyrophosphokinase